MFEITEQTKENAMKAMREILGDGPTDNQLEEAFDAAVTIVKRQFGM